MIGEINILTKLKKVKPTKLKPILIKTKIIWLQNIRLSVQSIFICINLDNQDFIIIKESNDIN